jgi:hypothetical protein
MGPVWPDNVQETGVSLDGQSGSPVVAAEAQQVEQLEEDLVTGPDPRFLCPSGPPPRIVLASATVAVGGQSSLCVDPSSGFQDSIVARSRPGTMRTKWPLPAVSRLLTSRWFPSLPRQLWPQCGPTSAILGGLLRLHSAPSKTFDADAHELVRRRDRGRPRRNWGPTAAATVSGLRRRQRERRQRQRETPRSGT